MTGCIPVTNLLAAVLASVAARTQSAPDAPVVPPAAFPPLVLTFGSGAAGQENDLAVARALGAAIALRLPPPDPAGPAGGGEPTYAAARLALEPLVAGQIPVILGWAGSALDHEQLSPEPVAFEDGSTAAGPINIHDPELIEACRRQLAAAIGMAEASGADIRGFWLGIGAGEGRIEHPSAGPLRPLFSGYDGQGAAAFGRFCRTRWNDDPSALRAAWGIAVESWEDLAPPRPLREPSEPAIDGRAAWSAFCRWREERLAAFACELVSLARSQTERPLGIRLPSGYAESAGGPYVGHLLSAMRGRGLSFAIIDGAHTLADVRYLDSVRRFYGVGALAAFNEPWRSGMPEIRKMGLISLLGGCDVLGFCGLLAPAVTPSGISAEAATPLSGSLSGGSAPGDGPALLRDIGRVLGAWSLQRPPGRVAFLQSAFTAMLRASAYSNPDVRNVYDDLLSEHFHLAAWAPSLGCPDIIDEQMILEGRLETLRVLIVPNTSYTVVPDEVLRRLAAWIEAGGWLVTCGPGCFLDRLDDRGVVRRGDGGVAAEWLGGLASGTVLAESVVEVGTAGGYGVDPRGSEWLGMDGPTADPAGCVWGFSFQTPDASPGRWVPILSDGRGRWVLAAIQRGAGGLLVCTEPVPLVDLWTGRPAGGRAENIPFFRRDLPRLLQALARRVGADDFAAGENIRVTCCGRDRKRGRWVFAGLIAEPSSTTARITLPAGMAGEAELILFGRQVSAAGWSDGTPLSFVQPPERELYRDPAGTLAAGTLPLAWPYARVEFVLPPPGSARGRPAELVIQWR